jgi:hypothetical protein
VERRILCETVEGPEKYEPEHSFRYGSTAVVMQDALLMAKAKAKLMHFVDGRSARQIAYFSTSCLPRQRKVPNLA